MTKNLKKVKKAYQYHCQMDSVVNSSNSAMLINNKRVNWWRIAHRMILFEEGVHLLHFLTRECFEYIHFVAGGEETSIAATGWINWKWLGPAI